ncbi:MAG: AtpZ/AtpI family protein [Novosphingobium sp.]
MAHDTNDAPDSPVKEDPSLGSLEARLAAARKAEDQRLAREHAPLRSGTGGALQIASTMVGYPLGGIVIGFVLDNVFDTLPWITIGLMFTAFVGACIQVMRTNTNRAR